MVQGKASFKATRDEGRGEAHPVAAIQLQQGQLCGMADRPCCAGARMTAYFYDDCTLAEGGMSGWQDVMHCGLFKRDGAALHFLRRWHVR